MQSPTFPLDEAERLALLHRLGILDSAAEARFDRITRLASELLAMPIALVSLVDHDRQWFKSRQGVEATETPRAVSFCGHAITQPDVFVVEDARADPRFADNPLVIAPPHVVFYAGAPLEMEGGYRVGTLCVIDHTPRTLTAKQLNLLADLAQWVVAELDQDLTRAVAQELERLRRVNEAILRSSNDAIITKSLDGSITSWNPAAERIFGYSAVEAIGQPMTMLFPPERMDEEAALLERIARKEVFDPFDAVRLRKDGTSVQLSVTLSPIVDDHGNVLGASKIARDITERKRMEQLKSEFVSTVSHELRTPLTSIQGALGLLQGRFAEGLPKKGARLLDMAVRNSKRLTLLVNDILDLEKIESGSMAFEFQRLDLHEAARSAVQANGGYAEQYDVTLALEAPNTPAVVWGDAHRIAQVFANLLSNACKYSPKGETVVVAVESSAETVRVRVCDRGPGIPEAFQPRLFERFSQADASDSRQKGGTGLGLNISQAIIQRHGGQIAYTAEPGAGAEFTFELPAMAVPSRQKTTRGGRVLICEDNLDVSLILQEMLEAEGLQSNVVHSASAAREVLASGNHTLLLLDLHLPDGDGLSLVRDLRAQPATQDLPVIVVSGMAEERRLDPGGAVSVEDWLQKPVDQAHIGEAVRRALGRTERPRVLHVEDDIDMVQVTKVLLEPTVTYDAVPTRAEAEARLETNTYDLIILDLTLADGSGAPLLAKIGGRCPVILFSGQDAAPEVASKVAAELKKSLSSHGELLEVVRQVLCRVQET